VARVPGRAATGTVLLVAHYDSAPQAPGAGDDGAAVAAVLESLRALRAGPALRNDVLVLLTDGEEMGLLGAGGFANDRARLRGVSVVLNFDARGNSGPVLMYQTSGGNGRLVAEYAAVAPVPGANSLMEGIYRRMPNDTDFTVFLRQGVPGLNFAMIEGYTAYHMPSDTPERLSRASLQHVGETMLALLRRLGEVDLAGIAAEDVVYFEVLGAWVARYPLGWTWPLALGAVVLFVAAVARARSRRELRLGLAATGMVLFAGTVVASALLSYGLFSVVVRTVPPSWVSYGAVGTEGDAWFFAASTCAALSVAAFACRMRASGPDARDLTAGALLLWVGLLVAAAFLFPAGAFVFQWPLLGALLPLALPLSPDRPWRGALAAAVGALPAVILGTPLAQRFFVALALPGLGVSTAAVALALGPLLPVVGPLATTRRPWLAAGAAGAAAVAVAVGFVRA
jgi:hypothetical protein